MGDENTQTYQVQVAILIQHQILVTNLQQLEGRINNQILGVKGLKETVLGIHHYWRELDD